MTDGQLIAADPTLYSFSLALKTTPDKDGVIVAYAGVPGNRPATYANAVALWDNWSPVIVGPHAETPLKQVAIPEDHQPSSVRMEWPLTGTDYLLTYQVGTSVTTMCAALQLSLRLGATIEPPVTVSLSITQLTSSTVTVSYSTLQGYRPKTFGNWVGIWEGFAGPYFAPPPDGFAEIVSDHTQGKVTIGGLQITPGLVYRVIYFMGAGEDGQPGSNVGAILTFEASETSGSLG